MAIGFGLSKARATRAFVAALTLSLLASLTLTIQSKADPSGDIVVSIEVMDSVPENLPEVQVVNLETGTTITSATVEIVLVALDPFSLVQIYVQSDPVLIASGFADKYGVFKVIANLPPTLEAGDHSVVALVQTKGQSKPTLKSLVKFAVSTNGKVTNKSKKPTKPVQESPAPSTTANAADIIQGVLFISGIRFLSEPTLDPRGNRGKVTTTVMNAYNKPYTLTVDETVKAWGLFELTRVESHQVINLKPKEARTLEHELKGIGQWGIYTVDLTVTPPETIDDLTLPAVHRDSIVFIVPLFPLLILILLAMLETLRRFVLMPYIRGTRLLKTLMAEDGNQA